MLSLTETVAVIEAAGSRLLLLAQIAHYVGYNIIQRVTLLHSTGAHSGPERTAKQVGQGGRRMRHAHSCLRDRYWSPMWQQAPPAAWRRAHLARRWR